MKKIYKFLLNKLPRPLLIRLSYPFKKVAPLLYKGNKVECPVCEKSFSKFLSYGSDVAHRENVLCPFDLTLERHRLMWLYLKDQSNRSELVTRQLAKERADLQTSNLLAAEKNVQLSKTGELRKLVEEQLNATLHSSRLEALTAAENALLLTGKTKQVKLIQEEL